MVSFAAILLMLIGFAVVAYPLLQPAARLVTGGATPGGDTEDLERERDAAYGAIKDLEFEYQLGNLSPEDFQGLREQYAERAARALSRLDAASQQVATAPGVEMLPPDICPLCRMSVDPDDRFCADCGAMLSRFCRTCGAQREPEDTSCARCGAALEAEA